MKYVYSTLTCDNEYADWQKAGDQQSIRRTVLVNGGHGVMNKNFMTPLGVETEVSDEDAQFLLQNDAFKFHMSGGFVRIEDKSFAPEKVIADMTGADNSAQLTPADYEPGGKLHVEGQSVSTKGSKTK